MNFKGKHRFDKTLLLDMGANPIFSKFRGAGDPQEYAKLAKVRGDQCQRATRSSINFIKYLLILLTIAGAYAQDGYFNATVYGINNDNVYVIDGVFVAEKPTLYEDTIEQFKMMQEHFAKESEMIKMQMEKRKIQSEIERQSYLLEQLNNE